MTIIKQKLQKTPLVSNIVTDIKLDGWHDNITKFEVMPTLKEIEVGEDTGYVSYNDGTPIKYQSEVSIATSHEFILRTDTPYEEVEKEIKDEKGNVIEIKRGIKIANSDVVIDWGDGTESILKGDFTPAECISWSKYKATGYDYTFKHDYKDSMGGEEIKKFIVTIKGKDYWGFNCDGVKPNPDKPTEKIPDYTKNIISRIFEADLPIAQCVNNMSTICFRSQRLVRLHAPAGANLLSNVQKIYQGFQECYNLYEVVGFDDEKFQFCRDVSAIFSGCINLKYSNFKIPANVLGSNGARWAYSTCGSLTTSITSLLPTNGFTTKKVNLTGAFRGCSALTGTIPAKILWDDTTKDWTASGCFSKSSLESQAPESWGGSNAEIVPMQVVAKTKKTVKTLEELFEVVKQLAKNVNWNIEISEELS